MTPQQNVITERKNSSFHEMTRNKLDEVVIIIKNKAILVAKGFNKQEVID